MKEETKLWLEKAKEAYEDALYNLEGHRYGAATFFAQQALERALKAAVVELADKRPPRTHDLIKLAKEADLLLPQKWLPTLRAMTKYYFLVRYPDMSKKFFSTPKIAKETVSFMKEVYQWVIKKLPQS